MHYGSLLWSMVKLMVTQPVLLQAFLIGLCSCSIFVSWCKFDALIRLRRIHGRS